MDSDGLDWIALGWAVDWIGLNFDCIRLGWIWIGLELDWIGLDCFGSGCILFGLDWIALDNG